jgi:hypothetical protein
MVASVFALSGCAAHSASSSTPGMLPVSSDGVVDATHVDLTTTPLVIHVGFDHTEHTDPTFGPVWYYSPKLTGSALVVKVLHGSKVVFLNDDPSGATHTASGLGPKAFPLSFDNSSGIHRSGTTVNGTLTWSTGALTHGTKSQIFTVGAIGHYFFGCAFHYTTKPTTTNGSMGDVLVSQ